MKDNTLEVQDTKVIRFITENKYKFLRHVVLLVGIFIIIFYTNWLSEYSGIYKYYRLLCVSGVLITMFYINMNILVPRFFFKGQYIVYLLLLLVLVVTSLAFMSSILSTFMDSDNIMSHQHHSDGDGGSYDSIIILFPIILVTTMIKLFQRWMRDNQKITELNNIAFTMELNELRNQINPHFLFNMLNGIKSLVRIDPEKATIVIMKLSEFLRYQLYENNGERTLLKSEINFISNFLDLEKLRRDNLSMEITNDTESQIINSVFLPPNLFTTFVENAVKHSVDIHGAESFVRINIKINGDDLYFNCINSKDPDYRPSSNEKSSGLGLGNIKRRLELLYGTNYTLAIASTDTKYEVKLIIPL